MPNSHRTSATSYRDQVEAMGPWFHNLHLPGGTQTAPDHFLGDFPRRKWEAIRHSIPKSLSGWTALDIGCNAGFYSFELARRGAEVLAIDHDPHYLRQAQWAADVYGLADQIRFEQLSVYDIGRQAERFDLILFMGVFYHLRYPLLALDLIAEKVDRLLLFQTLTMPGQEVFQPEADIALDRRGQMQHPGWPKMAFIEHRLADDPTNWWAPNHACVEAMLRSTGLRIEEQIVHEVYLCHPPAGGVSGHRTWPSETAAEVVGARRQ